jgi:hypothetical protein
MNNTLEDLRRLDEKAQIIATGISEKDDKQKGRGRLP